MRFLKPAWVRHQNDAAIHCIDVQPGSSRFVTGGEDAKVKVWLVAPLLDARLEAVATLRAPVFVGNSHQGGVRAVRWSTSGSQFASASDDGVVIVWELRPELAPVVMLGSLEPPASETWGPRWLLKGHSMEVSTLSWHPSDGFIASGGFDGKILVWSLLCSQEGTGDAARDPVAPARRDGGRRGKSSAPSASSSSASDPAAGAPEPAAPYRTQVVTQPLLCLPDHSSYVLGLSWDPFGRFLASYGEDKRLLLWTAGGFDEAAAAAAAAELRGGGAGSRGAAAAKGAGEAIQRRPRWRQPPMQARAENARKRHRHSGSDGGGRDSRGRRASQGRRGSGGGKHGKRRRGPSDSDDGDSSQGSGSSSSGDDDEEDDASSNGEADGMGAPAAEPSLTLESDVRAPFEAWKGASSARGVDWSPDGVSLAAAAGVLLPSSGGGGEGEEEEDDAGGFCAPLLSRGTLQPMAHLCGPTLPVTLSRWCPAMLVISDTLAQAAPPLPVPSGSSAGAEPSPAAADNRRLTRTGTKEAAISAAESERVRRLVVGAPLAVGAMDGSLTVWMPPSRGGGADSAPPAAVLPLVSVAHAFGAPVSDASWGLCAQLPPAPPPPSDAAARDAAAPPVVPAPCAGSPPLLLACSLDGSVCALVFEGWEAGLCAPADAAVASVARTYGIDLEELEEAAADGVAAAAFSSGPARRRGAVAGEEGEEDEEEDAGRRGEWRRRQGRQQRERGSRRGQALVLASSAPWASPFGYSPLMHPLMQQQQQQQQLGGGGAPWGLYPSQAQIHQMMIMMGGGGGGSMAMLEGQSRRGQVGPQGSSLATAAAPAPFSPVPSAADLVRWLQRRGARLYGRCLVLRLPSPRVPGLLPIPRASSSVVTDPLGTAKPSVARGAGRSGGAALPPPRHTEQYQGVTVPRALLAALAAPLGALPRLLMGAPSAAPPALPQSSSSGAAGGSSDTPTAPSSTADAAAAAVRAAAERTALAGAQQESRASGGRRRIAPVTGVGLAALNAKVAAEVSAAVASSVAAAAAPAAASSSSSGAAHAFSLPPSLAPDAPAPSLGASAPGAGPAGRRAGLFFGGGSALAAMGIVLGPGPAAAGAGAEVEGVAAPRTVEDGGLGEPEQGAAEPPRASSPRDGVAAEVLTLTATKGDGLASLASAPAPAALLALLSPARGAAGESRLAQGAGPSYPAAMTAAIIRRARAATWLRPGECRELVTLQHSAGEAVTDDAVAGAAAPHPPTGYFGAPGAAGYAQGAAQAYAAAAAMAGSGGMGPWGTGGGGWALPGTSFPPYYQPQLQQLPILQPQANAAAAAASALIAALCNAASSGGPAAPAPLLQLVGQQGADAAPGDRFSLTLESAPQAFSSSAAESVALVPRRGGSGRPTYTAADQRAAAAGGGAPASEAAAAVDAASAPEWVRQGSPQKAATGPRAPSLAVLQPQQQGAEPLGGSLSVRFAQPAPASAHAQQQQQLLLPQPPLLPRLSIPVSISPPASLPARLGEQAHTGTAGEGLVMDPLKELSKAAAPGAAAYVTAGPDVRGGGAAAGRVSRPVMLQRVETQEGAPSCEDGAAGSGGSGGAGPRTTVVTWSVPLAAPGCVLLSALVAAPRGAGAKPHGDNLILQPPLAAAEWTFLGTADGLLHVVDCASGAPVVPTMLVGEGGAVRHLAVLPSAAAGLYSMASAGAACSSSSSNGVAVPELLAHVAAVTNDGVAKVWRLVWERGAAAAPPAHCAAPSSGGRVRARIEASLHLAVLLKLAAGTEASAAVDVVSVSLREAGQPGTTQLQVVLSVQREGPGSASMTTVRSFAYDGEAGSWHVE